MKEQTKVSLSELREKAEKATSGEWFVDGSEVRNDCSPGTTETGIADCTVKICEVPRISEVRDHASADRDFIAAANPATVLVLVECIEIAMKALKETNDRHLWDEYGASAALEAIKKLVELDSE